MLPCASFASSRWADAAFSRAATFASRSFTRGSEPPAAGGGAPPPETFSTPPQAGHFVGAAAEPSRTRYIFPHEEHSRSMDYPPRGILTRNGVKSSVDETELAGCRRPPQHPGQLPFLPLP